MGKKNKTKKEKKVIPYTEAERQKKVMALQLSFTKAESDNIITPEIIRKMNNFAKTGESYIENIQIPEFSRELEIHLVNDRNQQSYIKLKFNKIRIPGEGDENPINQLNKLQEEIFN